jgi:hypothetical protein
MYLKDLKVEGGGVELIQLAQDRDRWQALVNTMMTCGFWRHVVSSSSPGILVVHAYYLLLLNTEAVTFSQIIPRTSDSKNQP